MYTVLIHRRRRTIQIHARLRLLPRNVNLVNRHIWRLNIRKLAGAVASDHLDSGYFVKVAVEVLFQRAQFLLECLANCIDALLQSAFSH